jgi:hypothetical protein
MGSLITENVLNNVFFIEFKVLKLQTKTALENASKEIEKILLNE